MSIQAFATWCDQTALGAWVRGSTWPFPLIETVHILALAVLLGGLLLIDMKLMGIKAIEFLPPKLSRELNHYMNWSIVLILVSGTLLYLSEAVKAFENAAFIPKVVLLACALVFHYTVHRKAVNAEQTPGWAPLAGAVSLFLWFGTGAAGRAIGFV